MFCALLGVDIRGAFTGPLVLWFFFLLALLKLSYNHYKKNLINETSDFRTEKTNKQQIITEYQRCTEMKNII